MSRSRRLNPTSALALFGLVALAPAALAPAALAPAARAQGSTPSTSTPTQAAPTQAPPIQTVPTDEENAGAEPFPILAITDVEVMHSKTEPEISVVVVRGLASSEGWTNGELVPLESGTPPDSVLDLVFVAHAPQESAPPSGYEQMHAILPLSQDHPFKGIRVRSATNSVLLRDLQGVVDVKPPVEPCKRCVGRHLVEKGGTAPVGVSADQLVREEDLPPHTRIIRASDGISDVQHNPDRLTIVLGEDGRIIEAVWE